jgi:hypothetical protein
VTSVSEAGGATLIVPPYRPARASVSLNATLPGFWVGDTANTRRAREWGMSADQVCACCTTNLPAEHKQCALTKVAERKVHLHAPQSTGKKAKSRLTHSAQLHPRVLDESGPKLERKDVLLPASVH